MNFDSKIDLSEPAADYSLLAPGPVNLHPLVRQCLALPMIHHRTPEFDQILQKVLAGIKKIFQTQENVYLLSSTGSGGMEALLVNVLSPGDKVLAIVSGKFGERWAEMARTFGAQVIEHKVPWGEACRPTDIEKILSENADIRAVLCQACETSTAVAHPIQELAKVIAPFSDTLFLVDAITALGAYPLAMDAWQIDGVVAGSQKAFMLPTGMSFISFSKKAARFFDQARCQRFYFDVRKELKANAAGETFFSSNVAIIRALSVVLNLIERRGLEPHFGDIKKRADFVRQLAPLIGLSLYAKSPSDSVTALNVPIGMDGQKLRLHLEEKYHITIMGGQDQAKGKIIRIGHMGYIPAKEMIRLMDCLALSMNDLKPGSLSASQLTDVHKQASQYWNIDA
jgi:aspartate aminotransferase-like enzyme